MIADPDNPAVGLQFGVDDHDVFEGRRRKRRVEYSVGCEADGESKRLVVYFRIKVADDLAPGNDDAVVPRRDRQGRAGKVRQEEPADIPKPGIQVAGRGQRE